jgi:hypothetical protein
MAGFELLWESPETKGIKWIRATIEDLPILRIL